MTRAVPPMTPEARLSPPASWLLQTLVNEAPQTGFGRRAKGPQRHAWEWPQEAGR